MDRKRRQLQKDTYGCVVELQKKVKENAPNVDILTISKTSQLLSAVSFTFSKGFAPLERGERGLSNGAKIVEIR